MAWYDAKRNRGYNNSGIIEPGYGGRKHAVYSSAAESYVTSEQVVEYGSYPGTHNPRGKELYKDGPEVGDNPLLRPWSSTHDRPKKSEQSSPRFSQSKPSPWNIVHRENNPAIYHYGKHNNDDDHHHYDNLSDDDEEEEEEEEYYNKEKHKGNGYAHYPVSHSTQPKNDPYYDTPHSDHYIHENNKGNNYNLPSYTVPVTTQPRKDPYDETSNKRVVVHNPPSPIKTRPNTSKGHVNYLGENTRSSPGSVGAHQSPFKYSSPVYSGAQRSPFTSLPMKDQGYQETNNSTEAQRRYGRAPPMAGAQAEQKHTGSIDSKEAAKRYNGVFVNY